MLNASLFISFIISIGLFIQHKQCHCQGIGRNIRDNLKVYCMQYVIIMELFEKERTKKENKNRIKSGQWKTKQ